MTEVADLLNAVSTFAFLEWEQLTINPAYYRHRYENLPPESQEEFQSRVRRATQEQEQAAERRKRESVQRRERRQEERAKGTVFRRA